MEKILVEQQVYSEGVSTLCSVTCLHVLPHTCYKLNALNAFYIKEPHSPPQKERKTQKLETLDINAKNKTMY